MFSIFILFLCSIVTFVNLIIYQAALITNMIEVERICQIVFVSTITLMIFLMMTNKLNQVNKLTLHYNQMVYEIIGNYFKQINLFYNKTGLHWHVVENHFWIELHVDKNIN